jgi:hypothetical protein
MQWLLGNTRDWKTIPPYVLASEVVFGTPIDKPQIVEIVVLKNMIQRIRDLCHSNEHRRGRISELVVDEGEPNERDDWVRFVLKDAVLVSEARPRGDHPQHLYSTACLSVSSIEFIGNAPAFLSMRMEMWPS